jgi:hypothetical protein
MGGDVRIELVGFIRVPLSPPAGLCPTLSEVGRFPGIV